jgi:hypothetical protein
MTYPITDTTMMSSAIMASDSIDTITLTGSGCDPIYTISSTNNTASGNITNSGLYWGLNGTSANPGQVLTSTGLNTGWANISLAEPNLQGATLKVNGDADFDGEVTIKGKNLSEMLEKIEERLAILHPNEKLEEKWDELKELGRRYKELEAEIIEKEAIWAILKK